MKKRLAMLLAATLVVTAFTGCGRKPEEDVSGNTDSAQAETTTETEEEDADHAEHEHEGEDADEHDHDFELTESPYAWNEWPETAYLEGNDADEYIELGEYKGLTLNATNGGTDELKRLATSAALMNCTVQVAPKDMVERVAYQMYVSMEEEVAHYNLHAGTEMTVDQVIEDARVADGFEGDSDEYLHYIAENEVNTRLMMAAIAKKEGLMPEDADYTAAEPEYLGTIGAESMDEYSEEVGIDARKLMHEDVLAQRVMQFLVDNAEVSYSEQTVTGVVVDATMSGLTVQTAANGPMLFVYGEEPVDDSALTNGVRLGEGVTVTYQGSADTSYTATKLEGADTAAGNSEALAAAGEVILAVSRSTEDTNTVLADLCEYPLTVGTETVADADALIAKIEGDSASVFSSALMTAVPATDLNAVTLADDKLVLGMEDSGGITMERVNYEWRVTEIRP